MAFLDDPYRAAMRASIRGYKLPGTKGQRGGPGAPRSPYESYLQPRLNGRMASKPSAGVSTGAAYRPPAAATAAGSGWLGQGWLGDPNPEEWNPLGDENFLPLPETAPNLTGSGPWPNLGGLARPPYEVEPGEPLERQGLTDLAQGGIGGISREAHQILLEMLRQAQAPQQPLYDPYGGISPLELHGEGPPVDPLWEHMGPSGGEPNISSLMDLLRRWQQPAGIGIGRLLPPGQQASRRVAI